MKQKPSHRTRDEATAYHEAGHAVVAIALGMRLKAVTIEPSEGCDGLTKRVAVPRIWRRIVSGESLDVHDRVNVIKEIQLCFAGDSAQNRHSPESVKSFHAQQDSENALTIFEQFQAGAQIFEAAAADTSRTYLPDAIERLPSLDSLKADTEALVALRWQQIEAVADALLEKRTLSGDEVCRIMLETSPGSVGG